MGGIGSGSYSRWNRKTTTGEIRSIDVRRWAREGFLEPGKQFSWAWWTDEEKTGSIFVSANHGQVILTYDAHVNGDEWESIREPVRLAYTACGFGGSRPWFICPAVGCGRRVAILYGVGKYFACRHCYDLAYGSQQEGSLLRLQRKVRKLRVKLGAEPYGEDLPNRPKGMHHRTYQSLLWQYHHYNDLLWRGFEMVFSSWRNL